MTDTLIYTATRFAVPPSGFDSDLRYMRKIASGGDFIISAGRTWQIGYFTINTGEPWLGFRFDIGVSGAEVDAVQTVVGGFTENKSGSIPSVSPIVTEFVLE